ncbi:MAG: AAA family ATPase [Proteobacteria bacterium]|nr:AAA family ATPase [Pseudomonadota bacterium]
MSSVNELLLWEKWRPKSIDDIILLPRIREHFKNGVSQNYIFYGHFGTGKTTLARILIGKYDKSKPFLELNSSLFTSIDVLRNKIDDFCKFQSIMETESDMKFVFLDEFERVSPQFQDAFKAFIEKYNKNVRFIITTNHIHKISDGIKSRIPQINFDCANLDEERYIQQQIFLRIRDVILPSENKTLEKQDIVNIVKKNFPDLRKTIVQLQNFLTTGSQSQSHTLSNVLKDELFSLIISQSTDYEKIYHFVNHKFGPEKIDELMILLGKPFIDFALEKNVNVEKLFLCNHIIADNHPKMETSIDPIVLGMSVIGKFKEVLTGD